MKIEIKNRKNQYYSADCPYHPSRCNGELGADCCWYVVDGCEVEACCIGVDSCAGCEVEACYIGGDSGAGCEVEACCMGGDSGAGCEVEACYIGGGSCEVEACCMGEGG